MENYSIYLPSYSIGTDVYKKIPEVCTPYGTNIIAVGGHKAMAAVRELLLEAVKGSALTFLDFVWYNGGEVFRSGCCYHRENGKIFYFQPGHESYPTFYNENVQKIITNAVRWACPDYRIDKLECPWVARIEEK